MFDSFCVIYKLLEIKYDHNMQSVFRLDDSIIKIFVI